MDTGKTPDSTETNPKKKTNPRTRRDKAGTGQGKNKHIMLKLMAGWTLLLALIVIGARQMWHDPKQKTYTTKAAAAAMDDATGEETALLQAAVPKCASSFSAFLASATPEERNQFVLSPVSTASKMSRFYSLNPWNHIDPATIQLTRRSILHLPGITAIETRWKTQDDKQIEAVFHQEDDQWHLDWEQFARFSDYPWSLYLAGTGPDDAEFRLLARERLADERKDESTISIVLYAPIFGNPGDTGVQSPEFIVPRDSKDGRLLTAAFKLARDHKRPFGSRLPDLNPEDMIRLRLKVHRSDSDNGRRFEITSIAACHWYSTDDPGVNTDAPPADGITPAPEIPSPAPEGK